MANANQLQETGVSYFPLTPVVDEIALSIVMPCLNEADTLATCIEKAQRAMREHGIAGEVIVADNGSTDGSPEIARKLGARVINVSEKGYGNALRGGISAAQGRYVIMGDADDSYDFLEIPRFFSQLQQGFELVQGCRLPKGGGTVMPNAMPWLHRWLGNPMFSFMVRLFFHAPIHDVYCGLRGFSKELFHDLKLQCSGMEFATEMVIKSSLFGKKISEIPITLHPDGRTSHTPHLRTFRDGWRTLRFFMMYSPKWLFLIPGLLLTLLGGLGYSLALPGLTVFGAQLDAHTLLVASLAILLGYQLIAFAISTKLIGIAAGWLPPDQRFHRLMSHLTLERGVVIGGLAFLGGTSLLAWAVIQWWQLGFGPLDYAHTMRLVVPGVTLAALGIQTIAGFFHHSMLNMTDL